MPRIATNCPTTYGGQAATTYGGLRSVVNMTRAIAAVLRIRNEIRAERTMFAPHTQGVRIAGVLVGVKHHMMTTLCPSNLDFLVQVAVFAVGYGRALSFI